MLPTFSGRATHLRTLTPSLPYAKQSTPDVQNEPKRSGRQSESGLRMGLERRQVSAFGLYWRRGSPLYPKTGSYIVYG